MMDGVTLALALPKHRTLGRPYERAQNDVAAGGPECVKSLRQILHEACCLRVIAAHLLQFCVGKPM